MGKGELNNAQSAIMKSPQFSRTGSRATSVPVFHRAGRVLINTPLQRGVSECQMPKNRFNGFFRPHNDPG